MDQEAEGPGKLYPGRDPTLGAANLSCEVTRGNIAGQIKDLSMIVAIEGLISDRRNPTRGPARQGTNLQFPAAPQCQAL